MTLPAIALALTVTACPPTGLSSPAPAPAEPPAAHGHPASAPLPADSLRDLYGLAVPFDAYFAAATRRRELWDEHYDRSRLEDDARRRAAAVPGPWHLLAVTVAGCSDSIGSLPYLARLADAVAGIEFRVVDAEPGGFVLDRHRAPDGRRATPTVLLLDAEFRLAGCWVEQPPDLVAWWRENDRPDAPLEERLGIKMGWYAADEGRATLDMTLAMLEAAGEGRMICPGAAPPP